MDRSPLLSDTINEAKAGHELTVTTFSLLYAADFADRLENEIIPALRAGSSSWRPLHVHRLRPQCGDGADRQWTRALFGSALVPDLVLYSRSTSTTSSPRARKQRHGLLGVRDAPRPGQRHLRLVPPLPSRLIREYNRLAQEFQFVSVNARRPIETIQADLRRHISAYLPARRSKPEPLTPLARQSGES